MPAKLTDLRPDPDALLARMRRDEVQHRRGRLKIFFGAAPGVGKSYAMLEAARKQNADGTDVVVGYVELHGRTETEARCCKDSRCCRRRTSSIAAWS